MDAKISELLDVAEAARRDIDAIERATVQRLGAKLLADSPASADIDLRELRWLPRYAIRRVEYAGTAYKVLLRENALLATLPEVADIGAKTIIAAAVGGFVSTLTGIELLWEVGALAQRVLAPTAPHHDGSTLG